MFERNQVHTDRWSAIFSATTYGAQLAHRPQSLKFLEKRTVILPDVSSISGIDLVVGDFVHISHMSPWGMAEKGVSWDDAQKAIDMDKAKYRIVAFATVPTAGRCEVFGHFCVLARVQNPSNQNKPNYNVLKDDESGKVLLHWAGALTKSVIQGPEDTDY